MNTISDILAKGSQAFRDANSPKVGQGEPASVGLKPKQKGRIRQNKPNHELILEVWGKEGLPAPIQELRFSPPRRWRFDYAWPAHKIALEVEGGVWINGGHNRGSGFVKNMEKYNHAAVLGWRVVRCVPKEVIWPATVTMLKFLLGTP